MTRSSIPACLLVALGAAALAPPPAMAERPIVIAHRGASGYLPEHTLESKAYAHALGAHYLEQDVVLTRDGVPIVLHDTDLGAVTDVAEVFPDRAREDGRFYAVDFTLEEVRRLGVRERRGADGMPRWPARFQGTSVRFRVPTLAEEIEFIMALNRSTGRVAGLYPELKAPAWHRAAGLDLARAVLDVLAGAGLEARADPVYLQCFDPAELRRVRGELGSKLRLVQLVGDNAWSEADVDYDAMRTPEGLAAVAAYADGIGLWIGHLFEPAPDGNGLVSTGVAEAARAAGLTVHAYTLRADELPPAAGTLDDAHRLLFEVAGVDGLFSDHPDKTLAWLAGAGLRLAAR